MEYKITTEQILEGAKRCPTAEGVLKAMFPDAFDDPREIEIHTAGLGQNVFFSPGPCRCGTIDDGVSFNTGGGPWIISFSDLMEMARISRRKRTP
jgi:hypothetical protein